MRYFIELSYDGSGYHGWQQQSNANTVQGVLTNCVSTYLRKEVKLTGCGRTDTGVHANQFFAHFDVDSAIDESQASFNLNNMLPKDIAIQRIFEVADDLHARFSPLSRTYHYYIHQKKNPFIREHSYYFTGQLDLDKMNEGCQMLFEFKDFTSFSKVNTDTKTNDCEIMEARWELSSNGIVFIVKANRFLRNMVRALVGTMIDVGTEKMSVSDFGDVIESKNRGKAGRSVPGHGLFLQAVEFGEGQV